MTLKMMQKKMKTIYYKLPKYKCWHDGWQESPHDYLEYYDLNGKWIMERGHFFDRQKDRNGENAERERNVILSFAIDGLDKILNVA